MKNRILLRTTYGSSACSGVIPSACITSKEHPSPSFGSIDSSSGFAYTIRYEHVDSTEDSRTLSPFSTAKMFIWKHHVHASNEEMEEPQVLFTCKHPEYSTDHQNQYNSLACMIPLSFQSNLSGLSIYWCSTNGVLCYYDNILGSTRSIAGVATVLEYQTLTRIPLEQHEYVTFVTSSYGHVYGSLRSLGEIVFIGTSLRKIWLCTKSTRPLELKARLVEVTGNLEEDETDSGNYWLGGLVSKLFTPSKESRRHSMGVSTMSRSFHESGDPIVSILTMSVADASVKRPSKGQKVIHPSSVSASGSIMDLLFFIISQSGQISTHSIAYDLRDKVYRDKCFHSISLKARMKRMLPELQSRDPNIIEKTVIQVQVLNAAMDDNCSCIVLCVKAIFADPTASTLDTNSVGRLYMLYCPIHSHDFSLHLGSVAWLSRYTSEAVISRTSTIQCAGMIVQSDIDKNYVDASVYSIIQSRVAKSQTLLQEEKPVTISGVHFGRFPDEIQKQIQVQIRDIDLPIDIAPAVISGAVGVDSVTDGFVAISSNGYIISTRLIFPVLSSASPRKTDARSKETIQLLKSHLLSEYVIYKRRLEQFNRSIIGTSLSSISTTNASSSTTILPPSITSADPTELSLASVAASKSLMDDDYGAIHRFGSKPIISNFYTTRVLEDVDEKCATHGGFVNFLIACQLYKKIDIAGRIQLRNHGELLHGVRGLIIAWQDLLEGSLHNDMGLSAINAEKMEADSMIQEQTKINQILVGCEETLSDFQGRLNSLQLLLYDDGSSKLQPSKLLFSYVFSLIGEFAKEAFTYRENHSDHQYDLMVNPGHLGWDEGVLPLSSTDEFMCLLERQLALIETIANQDDDTLLQSDFHLLIQTLCYILLDGFRDIYYKTRDESRYDAAKRLSISLVRKYCQDRNSEHIADLGFYLSLRHCYFEGIVDVCHAHFEYGKQIEGTYDISHYIRSVMVASSGETKKDDIYCALASVSDYRTGLPFLQFVLKWFADKALFGTVFELGKLCPHVLTPLIIDDNRFTDLLWIQHIRNNDFGSASMTLRREASAQNQEESGAVHSTIWKNRSLFMSLEKLCEAAVSN